MKNLIDINKLHPGNMLQSVTMAKSIPAIIIPDNATNGDMIMVMFPSIKIRWMSQSHIGVTFRDNQDYITEFELDWWNAPYEKEVENEIFKTDS